MVRVLWVHGDRFHDHNRTDHDREVVIVMALNDPMSGAGKPRKGAKGLGVLR